MSSVKEKVLELSEEVRAMKIKIDEYGAIIKSISANVLDDESVYSDSNPKSFAEIMADIRKASIDSRLEKITDLYHKELADKYKDNISNKINLYSVINDTVKFTEDFHVSLSEILQIPVSSEFKLQICICLLKTVLPDSDNIMLISVIEGCVNNIKNNKEVTTSTTSNIPTRKDSTSKNTLKKMYGKKQ